MRLPSLKFFLTLFLLLQVFNLKAQFTVPEKPRILYPVFDQVGVLSSSEEEQLNNKLIAFADSTSTEIQVVILPTTNGEDVNHAAWMIGETWKIGQKDVDNGVVLLVATDDRSLSIQQGRKVEQYLTASVAGQIIDYLITPSFRQGNYYQGIDRGTTALMEAVQGKFKPIAKKDSSGEVNYFKLLIFIAVVLFLLFLLFSSGKGGGGNYYDDEDDDVILSKRGRRVYPGGFFPFPPMTGGGFGGGFGRGGFGGGGGFGGFGGGGSFGGGGASGSW